MILGSSECNATQEQKRVNIKECFSIIYNETLSEEQTARLFHLIQDGINVNEQDEYGYTLLILSVRHGNYDLIQRIINFGANLSIENFDTSPLHDAAYIGYSQIVSLLIKSGANINAQDSNGKTALHLATELHNAEMAQLLLSLGANPNLKDVNGRTPLHMAAIYRFTDITRLLLNNSADINAIDNGGKTPLHLSFKSVNTEVAKILIDKGADSTIKNRVGKTPLQEALDETFLLDFDPAWLSQRLNNFFKNILLLFIMKFVEADDWRFEHLREMLGEGFSSVNTADEMIAEIIAKPKVQVEAVVAMIDILYPNAAKMTPISLVTRLLDAIEYPPIQECAASASSSSSSSSSSLSSQDCVDDEQPPAMIVTSVRKRDQRDSDSEQADNTKRCRTLRSFFCR